MAAAAAAGLTGALGAATAVLGAVLAAGALAAGAFAAGFAVLCCISLLFFEDLVADAALWAALAGARARLLDALRWDAAVFLVSLEALGLRVFCDTACARNCHAPVRWWSREPREAKTGLTGFS